MHILGARGAQTRSLFADTRRTRALTVLQSLLRGV